MKRKKTVRQELALNLCHEGLLSMLQILSVVIYNLPDILGMGALLGTELVVVRLEGTAKVVRATVTALQVVDVPLGAVGDVTP